MNKISGDKNQEKVKTNDGKKKYSFLTKLVMFIALIFFGGLAFKYWMIKEKNHFDAKNEVEKYDNIDSEIFDLGDDQHPQKGNGIDPDGLPDLTVNELKEKGAEFIYQMLLKNQVQINDLREQVKLLQDEVLRYKNHERIGRLIFAYIDLRQKFLAGDSYDDVLQNFEMFSAFDYKLQDKVTKLKSALSNFSTTNKLQATFAALIPDIIATKNNRPGSDLLSKIRYNISKLVVIRKIDGRDSDNVEVAITETEKFLRDSNFQSALITALSLDSSYHDILKSFLNDLSASAEVQKIDEEILNYLKSLS